MPDPPLVSRSNPKTTPDMLCGEDGSPDGPGGRVAARCCCSSRRSRYHRQGRIMHTLLFLEPGHFHAALTLRMANPRVGDDVFVYARDGAELRDFLALAERFNQRVEQPTAWRPQV